MKRLTILSGKLRLLIVLLILISIAPAAAQEPDIVALVNQARANAGIAPLVSSSQLVSASQRHSNDMAAGDFLSHTGSDGSSVGTRVSQAGYTWNTVGENILYRWDVSAQGAFDQWWNSPGHRNNMMNAAYCDIGVTRAQTSGGRIYYTMVLARRSGVSTCPTPTPPPSATLNGTLSMQGRPSASGALNVQVTLGSATTTHTPNAANGSFTLSGLGTGSASVRVKHAQSLAVVRALTLAGGGNSLAVGELRMGDANNDNRVTLTDFSILSASFNRSIGQSGYDARADLNGDNLVSLQDFSLLASNFNQIGQ